MHYILDEPKILFSFFITMFYLLQYVGIVVKPYEHMSRYCKMKNSVILQNKNRVCAENPSFFDVVRGDLESPIETRSAPRLLCTLPSQPRIVAARPGRHCLVLRKL